MTGNYDPPIIENIKVMLWGFEMAKKVPSSKLRLVYPSCGSWKYVIEMVVSDIRACELWLISKCMALGSVSKAWQMTELYRQMRLWLLSINICNGLKLLTNLCQITVYSLTPISHIPPHSIMYDMEWIHGNTGQYYQKPFVCNSSNSRQI